MLVLKCIYPSQMDDLHLLLFGELFLLYKHTMWKTLPRLLAVLVNLSAYLILFSSSLPVVQPQFSFSAQSVWLFCRHDLLLSLKFIQGSKNFHKLPTKDFKKSVTGKH